jgi:hypothetical protein
VELWKPISQGSQLRHLKASGQNCDMELQLFTKKHTWANAMEIHTYNDGHALIQPDQLQALAVDIYFPLIPDWMLDLGVNAHVIRERNLLLEIGHAPISSITSVGGQALPIIGQGTTRINKNKDVYPIMYIHGMHKNLLSVGKLANDGNYTLFGSRHCWIFEKKTTPTMSSSQGLDCQEMVFNR